jgi:hypothetical protein
MDRNHLIFDPPPLGAALYHPGLPGGGSKIYDRSIYGNHGNISGVSWVKSPGGIWGQYHDGGDDVVIVPHSDVFNISTGFTFIVWFNPVDVSSARMLLCKSGSILHKIFLSPSVLKIGWQRVDGGYPTVYSSNEVNVGSYNFCAVSCSITDLDFYGFINLNGFASPFSDTLTVINNNAYDIYLGRNITAADGFYGTRFLQMFFRTGLSQIGVENIRQRTEHFFGV